MNMRERSVSLNRTLVGLAVLLMACSGCSYVFVKAPPPQPELIRPEIPIDCTSSKLAPVVDGIIGAYQVVRTGFAVGAPDSAYVNSAVSRPADILLGLGLTALFASSTIYGAVTTTNCDRVQLIHSQRAAPPSQPSGALLPSPSQPTTSELARVFPVNLPPNGAATPEPSSRTTPR